MIVTFRHKGLKLLFEKGERRKVTPDHADKISEVSLAWMRRASPRTWICPDIGCTR